MIKSNKLKADQDIEMKKLRDFNKWLKNISKEDDKRFERVTEENALEVAELKDSIISLKQRCTALQYESKQGKQNKKKRNVKERFSRRESCDKAINEYIKNNLVGKKAHNYSI